MISLVLDSIVHYRYIHSSPWCHTLKIEMHSFHNKLTSQISNTSSTVLSGVDAVDSEKFIERVCGGQLMQPTCVGYHNR